MSDESAVEVEDVTDMETIALFLWHRANQYMELGELTPASALECAALYILSGDHVGELERSVGDEKAQTMLAEIRGLSR